MAGISVQNVTKQFGTKIVLEDACAQIRPGETVGLVGTNGAGKTTLFRLITGELDPDLGKVVRAKRASIGYLRQEPQIDGDRTLHEEVGQAFDGLLALERRLHDVSERMALHEPGEELDALMAQYERINAQFIAAGGHTFETRLNEILGGLGFSQSDQDKPMALLSGGQKCRAALAKLLLEDRPLLLLDEPTNHLDIDAVRWLEKFLAGHRGGAVVISHDRYLLNRLCGRIIEVADRRTESFPGNYSNYAETKQRLLLTEQRQFEKDQAFIKKERAFIAKHLAGQRTAEAKGRRKRLERRLSEGAFTEETTRVKRTAGIRFDKPGEARTTGPTALRTDGLTMAFGDHELFRDLSFQLPQGERLGITGPNGTGKTTLLRILLGHLDARAGTVTIEGSPTIAYYSQEHTEMDTSRTVLEEIRACDPALTEERARTFLARFLFLGDDVFKTIGLLSGGEQSRVRLAAMILKAPDLLVLDEPTNHLDIPSREVLEEALLEFPGTIVAVSHDRFFLDRVATRLLVMRRDACTLHTGNYTSYIEWLESRRKTADAPASKTAQKKATKQPATDARASRQSPYDSLSIDDIEAMVIEHEEKLAALQDRFGDPAVLKDPDALGELKEETEHVEQELAELDRAWQERAAHQ